MKDIQWFARGLAAAALVLVAGSAAAAGEPQKSVSRAGTIPSFVPDVVLYDQNNNAGTASTVSQNFEAANDAFDNELADDFVVPAGGWAIDNISVTGLYFNGPGPAANVHVAFYNNARALPGAAVAGCDYSAVVPVGGPSFSIPLAPACTLVPGTYWVSVLVNMSFTPNGEWGWTDRLVTSNSPAAWRNPGGGFGTPCAAFTARGTCIPGDAVAPDQMFSLSGVATPVELMGFSVE